jgi:hypothetical protein
VVDEGGVPEELPTTPPQTGVFVEPLGTTIKFPNQGSATGLAQGDFNQDGLLDLAVAEDANVQDGRRVSIILGNGDGTFSEPTYHVIPQDPGFVNVHAVLAHDFDRDGPLDLLVPMAERHQVNFYRGDGNGGFAAPVPSSMGGPAAQIQTADLNCDGILDFAAIIDVTHVTVGFGNGDGTFATPTRSRMPTRGAASAPRPVATRSSTTCAAASWRRRRRPARCSPTPGMRRATGRP